jgi:DNA modification methylase
LLCADSRQERSLKQLFGSQRAAMIFTDPPYNVRIASVQGRGCIRHREFNLASGEMSPPEFQKFLTETLDLAAKYSEDGSIHFVCMDWRHIDELSAAGKAVYTERKNIVVWRKTNAGQGSFYRSEHEFIFVFKYGTAPHRNNFELGQHSRSRSNVWTYAGVNTFRHGRMEELSLHPTVKPVALVADAIRDCSRRGEIIFDPFMGSGTTILAAERVGRHAYGVEIDPGYVDVAIRRWQEYTKRDAVLSGTRQTFEEVAAARRPKRSVA